MIHSFLRFISFFTRFLLLCIFPRVSWTRSVSFRAIFPAEILPTVWSKSDFDMIRLDLRANFIWFSDFTYEIVRTIPSFFFHDYSPPPSFITWLTPSRGFCFSHTNDRFHVGSRIIRPVSRVCSIPGHGTCWNASARLFPLGGGIDSAPRWPADGSIDPLAPISPRMCWCTRKAITLTSRL